MRSSHAAVLRWFRNRREASASLRFFGAKRCAYWVSLRGAPPSPNDITQTVYIPRNQVLSVDTLTAIMTRCSRDEEMLYVA